LRRGPFLFSHGARLLLEWQSVDVSLEKRKSGNFTVKMGDTKSW
jgi:hypothetical protein